MVIDPQSISTFAEIFRLDERKYAEDPVRMLQFSNRTSKRFRQNNIVSICDLLCKTPSQMMRIEGFGIGCLTEIEEKLSILAENERTDHIDTETYSDPAPEAAACSVPNGAEIVYPNDDIIVLPLSVRTSNCLQKASVTTFAQMLNLTQDDMLEIRNMGQKSVQELVRWQESLRTGADGFFYIADSEVSQDSGCTQSEECIAIIEELDRKLGIDPNQIQRVLQAILRKEPVCGETLLYKLYDAPMVMQALRRKVLRVLRDVPEGMKLEAIHSKLPQHLGNTTILEELLLVLERDSEITEQEGCYRKKYPTLSEFLLTLPDREQLVLRNRVNGQTLAEVGIELDITRERVRQLERNALKKRPRLEEDKYYRVFNEYYFSKEDFMLSFSEPEATYNYLEIVAENKADDRRPLEDILEDDSVPVGIKKNTRRAIYKDYVLVDGIMIAKRRSDLVRYAVQCFAKDKISYDDFVIQYLQMLENLGLDDERLLLNGRTYSNYLANSNYALWNYNNSLRFYNIAGTNFTELLDVLNLSQYENIEFSTYKLFRDHAGIMQQYDIRDEYELHSLLKKINIPDVDIHFLRMPNILIGTASREEQALELLIQHAPISAYDLADRYEEEYGVKAPTAMANYFGQLDVYYHNGIYSIDFPALSTEHEQRMTEILTEDFYPIAQVVRCFRREFPDLPTNLINSYSLKTLGFLVYSGYVVRNTYSSAREYFIKLLTENDVIDLRDFNPDLMYRSSFTVLMYNLRAEREIVEFAPKQYINIRRLRAAGCDMDQIDAFCDSVAKYTEQGDFFTVQSLRRKGFEHELFDLGFEDYFYSALLAEDKRNFACRNMGVAKLFLRGSGESTMEAFLRWLLEQKSSFEIHDLVEFLYDEYGIKTDVTDLRINAQNAGLYYDSIMKTVYIDYDTYFEEI